MIPFSNTISYFTAMRFYSLLFILLVVALFQGCTCCVYYNHMFNAERAWEEGNAMQKARRDSLPADTTWIVNAERAKYDRVIEKCSRTLERFPDDVDSKPRAVFLIAESFRKKGEWTKAVIKYDEFERYFAKHDSMPVVEFQRAFSLYKNGDYAISRFALNRVLDQGEKHLYYPQALQLLSQLEEQALMPELAIQALEKVLASGTGTPFMRGKMHLRLAELYFKQESWQKSYEHYRSKEIAELDVTDRIKAGVTGVEALIKLKNYKLAIQDLSGYEKLPEYLSIVAEVIGRKGEIYLLNQQEKEGLNTLLGVTKKYPKTLWSTRAWYFMGDYEQQIKKNYPLAIMHYDSAWTSWATSEWGQKSKQRRDALIKLRELRVPNSTTEQNKLTEKQEFQIAELFMFRLNELDSAIRILDSLVDKKSLVLQDSVLTARAAYARAFIYDEFKNDSLKADSLYYDVIRRFPGTKVAQQAQINLGIRVTEKTKEDLAQDAFLKAESLWVSMETIPVDSIRLLDSLFLQVLNKYDTVAIEYAGTQIAGKALYAVGWLLENQGGQLDSSRAYYEKVRTQYGNSPWGIAALNKLQPRLRITDQEITRLRRRLEQNVETNDRLRRQYEEEQKRKLTEKPANEVTDPSLEEVLETDYNSLYDFQ